MLTKTVKTIMQPVEVEIFQLELTKEQLIELGALLGNCRGGPPAGLYEQIYDILGPDCSKLHDWDTNNFGDCFSTPPVLKHI